MQTIIIYQSKKNATKVCCEKLLVQLKGNCKMVTFEEVEERMLKEADQIVLGTPIYMGMMANGLKSFLASYEMILKEKRVFLMISCMNANLLEEYLRTNLTEAQVKLFSDVICVGGAFYFDRMNIFEKLIIKMIKSSENKKKGIHEKVNVKTNEEMFDEDAISKLAMRLKEA